MLLEISRIEENYIKTMKTGLKVTEAMTKRPVIVSSDTILLDCAKLMLKRKVGSVIVKNNNKDCKLIITISPVHLWATFREDMDVISANCNSKSTLRAVADEFVCRHNDVFYFPSYEIATSFTMMMNKTCFEKGKENFHINKETVELIMKHFFKVYSKGVKF